MLQQLLYHTTEYYSVLSFISEVWFSVYLSLLFSFFLFFCWYFGFELQKQKDWLRKHKDLIGKYKVLKLHLNHFGKQMPSCKNCQQQEMQLWDYKQQLLVVRCRSCKRNYTFTKGHSTSILKVLLQIEDVKILLKTLLSYRSHPFGRLLARLLDIDIALVGRATTPLEIIHFKAWDEYMRTPKAVREMTINNWEVVAPQKPVLLASKFRMFIF